MSKCIQCQTETKEKLVCGFCNTCLEDYHNTGEHTIETKKEIKFKHKTRRIQIKGRKDEKKNKKTVRRVVYKQSTIHLVQKF